MAAYRRVPGGPGGWLKVTFGLTTCTPGSALGPTLGNEYGRAAFLSEGQRYQRVYTF